MKYICPDCGKQYETGKFCLECGAKLQETAPELVCPSCGFKAKSGKFCPECGTKLEEQCTVAKANSESVGRKFNNKDPRLAKYYSKTGFPRFIPQEERDIAFEELKSMADQGIAEAMMLLSFFLDHYGKSKTDFRQSYSLLSEAERLGDKTAYYLMSIFLMVGTPDGFQDWDEAERRMLEINKVYEGEGNCLLATLYSTFKIDYNKALRYAEAAIALEKDEKECYKIIGDLYLDGLGVSKDTRKAFENYKMAAAFGNAGAMNQIGWLYHGNEEGFEENPEQAFYWYNESAKKGSEVGMSNVGGCYKYGFGVKKDDEIAAEWFKKSAELGYVNAMNELGDYYQNVLIDLEKAESWYRKGADLGDAECQNKLGVLLANNFDYEEANSWYQKAMEQGMPNAFNNYAINLWEGDGVAENKQKAIELKQKAIELGLEDEVNRLGVWYGQIGDDEKANECFLKAIDQEDPWGYYNYAWSLWNGTATEINKDKAIEFMSKAAEMGLEEAQSDLEGMQNEASSVDSFESTIDNASYADEISTKVAQRDYIGNLRVDRSWVLPQMIHMSKELKGVFKKEYVFSPTSYIEKIKSIYYNKVWSIMLRNYKALSIMYKANPVEYAHRASWWTKEVAVRTAQNDFSLLREMINKEPFANNNGYHNWSNIVKVDRFDIDQYNYSIPSGYCSRGAYVWIKGLPGDKSNQMYFLEKPMHGRTSKFEYCNPLTLERIQKQRPIWWNDNQRTIDDLFKEFEQRIAQIQSACNPTELYEAIKQYADNRCIFKGGIGCSFRPFVGFAGNMSPFINAYMGDGSCVAMRTMVRYLGLTYDNMNRDQCLADIDNRAKDFNYDGHKMFDYCADKLLSKHPELFQK